MKTIKAIVREIQLIVLNYWAFKLDSLKEALHLHHSNPNSANYEGAKA